VRTSIAQRIAGYSLPKRLSDPSQLQPLLQPAHPERLGLSRVSTWVNAPAHNDARCIAPVTGEDSAEFNGDTEPGESGGLFGQM
jgi:hypothetical protein